MNKRPLLIFIAFALMMILRAQAHAAISTRSLCDRKFNPQTALNAAEMARVNSGQTVLKTTTATDSGSIMVYGIRWLKADAELAMGIAESFEEESDHVSTLAQSKVLARKGAAAEVHFEVNVDSVFIPNSEFDSLVKVAKEGQGYLQWWSLVAGYGLSKPEFSDGYIRIAPDGKGALMTYCAYNVPSMKIAMSMANSMQLTGVSTTIHDLSAWIEASEQNASKAAGYRAFLEKILK